MKITEYMKDHLLILDGGMGSLLQERGLPAGEQPERWNLSHPEIVTAIQKAYFDAGSQVINTNTFGANSLKYDSAELEEVITAAVKIAKTAREESTAPGEKYIALDIGPTGKLLKPLGDLDFEDAVSVFAQSVRIGVRAGVDLIMIETLSDCYETKAALLAAKENSDLPVFVSNAYSENGRLMTGATPAAMVAMLEGMGADAIGVNCSFGPAQLAPVVSEYLQYASVPVLLKPNAGLPRSENGKTVYDISANEFADTVAAMLEKGVRIAGGCCGTTPAHIAALKSRAKGLRPRPVIPKNYTSVSSFAGAVFFGTDPVLIGERINPTGKKRFQEALKERDMEYVLNEGFRQIEAGAHLLDVNVGVPGIDEDAVLEQTVCELQSVTELPLQIDTSSFTAMERAMRRYNGKPMINSVNGKKTSMEAVFPLVKKYGGTVVALTLDEDGIPPTAEGRVAIARKILKKAAEYGIKPKDIVFDTLVMTVSAAPDAAQITLDAMRRIRTELGVHTSLGVSNVSFGLPARGAINAAFFAAALQSGLSAAIMNPLDHDMMRTYHAFRVLSGKDENCEAYIAFTAQDQPAVTVTDREEINLTTAIIKGMKEKAAALTARLLETEDPLALVNDFVIPALDTVGKEYEAGKAYLPQLLMSAEAAKAAFELVKQKAQNRGGAQKCRFVIATVKGDIHDIGKNIVKLLLENYGFAVTDLGKDVPPEEVVRAVKELHAPLAGLSALMTTTVPSMEETIRQLRKETPWCKIAVGGAVMTQEYADSIGADFYGKDAMDTVRYSETVFQTLKEGEF